MTLLGVDIGSRNVKIALEEDNNELRLSTVPTPVFYRKYLILNEHHQLVINKNILDLPEVDHVAATGYGRNNIGLKDVRVISEIQAHTLGAAPKVDLAQFLLLDLGGQDTKVILVCDQHVEDFQINDKCASGSGRYLENMAEVLGIDISGLFTHYVDPIDLSTTCATYAESELIGKIADGIPLGRLCAGVNHSTFLRIRPMLEHWPEKNLVFVGGGAKNIALVHYLKNAGYKVIIPDSPEFTGALGCINYIKQELEYEN